jgi:hypothetical protein
MLAISGFLHLKKLNNKRYAFIPIVQDRGLSFSSFLLVGVLMLMLSGCFAGRSFTPLSVENAKYETVAILPITPKQVRFLLNTHDFSDQTKVQIAEYWVGGYADVVKYTNVILNTLASGKNSKLIGPDEVQRTLKGTTAGEWVHVCLDDPGPLTEVWKEEMLAEIGRKLKVDRIVVVKPKVEIAPLGGAADYIGFMIDWRGDVTVKVEIIGLSPLQLIATHTGQADFWGACGVVNPLPFALGKGLDRALDHATRQALSELLNASAESTNVP